MDKSFFKPIIDTNNLYRKFDQHDFNIIIISQIISHY